MDRLRVGVIGVHPERRWAREAHVPAVRAVEGTFAHAVRLSRLIDDLTAASDTGTTVTPTGQWPA